jgi:hypothetical protein
MEAIDPVPSTDESLTYLIGASLPTSAACQAAIDLLRAARDDGASRDTLSYLAGIAVWDGLPAARAALQISLHDDIAQPVDDDRIIFALDEDEELPTNLAQPHSQLTLSL